MASETVSAGELDCLAVLWWAYDEGQVALKLSDIHERVARRREELGEAPPQRSTISTYLRTLLNKQMLNEVMVGDTPGSQSPQIRTRGARGILPPTRSPYTGYQVAREPGEVLEQTYRTLANVYPPRSRGCALVDFARALGLPDKIISQIEELTKSLPLEDADRPSTEYSRALDERHGR